jgi:MarR family transcriptional regulator, organic hydroperoxide resistance regulator
MEDSDPLALDRQVCFALAAASRTVIGLYRPVLEPLGLTHPQYLVMLALWERSPRTVRNIGEALALEPATLSPLLKRLESAGLLSRTRKVDDERSLDVELTPAGRALRTRAEAVPAQIVQRLGMPVAELEATRDALTRLLVAAQTPWAPDPEYVQASRSEEARAQGRQTRAGS